jgi:hypothetical protein
MEDMGLYGKNPKMTAGGNALRFNTFRATRKAFPPEFHATFHFQ